MGQRKGALEIVEIKMDKNFWKNKNVLITGNEGFLGSNLTKMLIPSGANIVGLDIEVKRKSTCFAKEDYKKITTIKGSVSDYNLVKKIISKYKIDAVFSSCGVRHRR